MFFSENSNLNKLSYGFAILFIAFGGIQHYLTHYFNSLEQPNVGFNILLIMYTSVFLNNFFVPFIINKFSIKILFIITTLFYLVSMMLILFTNEYIAYLGAIILGFWISVLWNSQNGYLLKISSEKNRGINSGFFISIFQTGSLLGVIILGLIIEVYGFKISFLIVLGIGFLSLFLFLNLDCIETVNPPTKTFLFSLKTITLFKVSIMNSLSYHLIFGLSFSLIPLHIYLISKSTFTMAMISSLFYLFPILFSKKAGTYSDEYGRSLVALIGAILSMLGLLLFHFSDGLFLLIIASILLAMSMALLNPIFIAIQGDISTSHTQSYIINIFMFFKYLGLILGIYIGMFLGIKLAYLVIIGFVGIGLLFGYKLMLDISSLKIQIKKEMDLMYGKE